MYFFRFAAIIVLVLLQAASCIRDDKHINQPDIDDPDNGIPSETLTDIDGNVYKTVKIGGQIWMAEDLKVKHYRNGDIIPNVLDDDTWSDLAAGAWCTYNNDSDYFDTHGCLYNWYAAADSRGLAPAGWHVPSDEDWKQLEMHLGMSQSEADSIGWRGSDVGGKLKEAGTDHWDGPNTGAVNESGFTALAGGYRHYTGGGFRGMRLSHDYWTSLEYDSDYAWARGMDYATSKILRAYAGKEYGFGVRLVKD